MTELKGSSLNQVVKVNPVSCGHLVRGGTITADPAFPGKLKKTSGPDLKTHRAKYTNYIISSSQTYIETIAPLLKLQTQFFPNYKHEPNTKQN